MLGGIFNFIQILIEHSVSKQWRPDQMPHSAASDLGLHCFFLCPSKKNARLIWVNVTKSAIMHIFRKLLFSF